MDDNRKVLSQSLEADLFSLAGHYGNLFVIRNGAVTGTIQAATTEPGTPEREAAMAELRRDLDDGMTLGGGFWYMREDAHRRW
ncbi:MAG: hypothetical protein RLY86_2672 [Pseudomonadota bacterium]|jgi:L-rhamnose isomerase